MTVANERIFDAAARDYDQGRRRLLPGMDEFYGNVPVCVETRLSGAA